MIEWINYLVQDLSFENTLVENKRKLNFLKKHGLVEGNVVLLHILHSISRNKVNILVVNVEVISYWLATCAQKPTCKCL